MGERTQAGYKSGAAGERLNKEMIIGGSMRLTCSIATVVFLCIHAALAGRSAQAAPVESHEHWEHIVKRSALSIHHDSDYEDDTAHIVDVREYYREVLRDGWDEYVDNEEDLFNRVDGSDGTPGQGQIMNSEELQEVASKALRVHQKPIKGRYIVMFHPDTSDYALDRTIEILQKANEESNQRLRATDISPFRSVHRGFTATLNSKTVELVSTVDVVWLWLPPVGFRYKGCSSFVNKHMMHE